jgi:glycopeptide antibiotics resistance protein
MKDIGYMMDIILRYIQDTGFYMLLVMPIILIVRYLHIKRFKVQTSFLHELGLVIFFMILTGLLSQTILPTIYSSQGEVKFINGDHRAINLELFRVFGETYNAIKFLDLWQPLLINFVGNIVMFMPIGFFLPLLYGGILTVHGDR